VTAPKAYTATHRAADAGAPRLRRAWQRAWAKARHDAIFERLDVGVLTRNPEAVVDSVPWSALTRQLVHDLAPAYLALLADSAEANRRALPALRKAATDTARTVFRFNRANPAAMRAAERLALDLVRGITEDARQAIRALVRDMFSGGDVTVDEVARRVRDHLGLTARQSQALRRRQEDLFRQAAAEDAPMTEARAEAETARYAQRLRADRALTIARTESMRAANAGQQELWRQAEAEGYLPPTQQREWLVTPDELLCEICAPIPGNGPVGLREAFVTGSGNLLMHPPAHPNCRCTTALLIDFGD
jgi:hypothetical protein